MKVKNIMFFGFAAAILSAGAANAAPNYTEVTVNDAARKIVASKAYVDAQGNKLNTDIGLKQNQLGGTGLGGKLVTSTTTAGDVNYTDVASSIDTSSDADNANIPTVGAVEGAITSAVSTAGANYQPKSDGAKIGGANGTWTALDQTITAQGTSAPVTSAVKTYADSKVNETSNLSSTSTTTAPNEKLVYDMFNSLGTAADANVSTTGVADDENDLVTGDQVYDAITSAVSTAGANYQPKSDGAKIGGANGTWTALDQTVTSSGTSAPVTSAVYTAVEAKQDKTDGAHNGQVVTATGTAGSITYTAIDTTVTNNSSNLVTSGAVYNATGGNNIPAQPSACSQEGNTCALVSDEGTLKWVVMADDQHNGSVPSNNQ